MQLSHKKYRKVFFLIYIVSIPVGIYAQDAIIHQTYPGTGIRDLSKPRKVIDDGMIYETFPGTDIKDLSQPRYVIDDDGIHETFPGTGIRDLSKPGYEIEFE